MVNRLGSRTESSVRCWPRRRSRRCDGHMSLLPVLVGTGPVDPADVVRVAREGAGVRLAEEALDAMTSSRAVVDKLAGHDEPHYGISTGFGALATTHIPVQRRAPPQCSLVRPPAPRAGPPGEREGVPAPLLLRPRAPAPPRTRAPPGPGRAPPPPPAP